MLLYIKNLPPDASKNHIRALFAGLGITDYEAEMTEDNSAFITFKKIADQLRAYHIEDATLLGNRLTMLLVSQEEKDMELDRISRDHYFSGHHSSGNSNELDWDIRLSNPQSTSYKQKDHHVSNVTRSQSSSRESKSEMYDPFAIDYNHHRKGTSSLERGKDRIKKDRNIYNRSSYQFLEHHEQTRSHSDDHLKESQEPSSSSRAQEKYDYTNTGGKDDWSSNSGKLLQERSKLESDSDLYYNTSVSGLSRNPGFEWRSGGSNAGTINDFDFHHGSGNQVFDPIPGDPNAPNTSLGHSTSKKGFDMTASGSASGIFKDYDTSHGRQSRNEGLDQGSTKGSIFENRPTHAKGSPRFDPISSGSTLGQFMDYDASFTGGSRSLGFDQRPATEREEDFDASSYHICNSEGLDLVSHGSNAGVQDSNFSRNAPMSHLPLESKQDHYLVLKGLPSNISIRGIYKLFETCNIIKGSTKIICSNGETQYAYIEVESSQDVFTACQIGAYMMEADGYVLSVKPILKEVLEHNLETIKLLQNSKDSPLEIVTEDSEGSHLRTDPQWDDKHFDEMRPGLRDGVTTEHKTDHDTGLKRRALSPVSLQQTKKPMIMEGSAQVKFNLIPFPEDMHLVVPNVLDWIQKKMEHAEVLGEPEMDEKDTPQGTLCTVTLCIRTPLCPAFPRFAVMNKLGVVINGPEKKNTCPACRSVHDPHHSRSPCIAVQTGGQGQNLFYLTDPATALHPSAQFSCTLFGMKFKSIQDAIDHQLRMDLGSDPDAVHKLKLRAWAARSFDLLLSLYQSQIEENKVVALALKASAQRKIIFVSEDRVLGSGTFDHVDIQTIQTSYMPGENYIGIILEELRDELTLAEQGLQTIFNLSRLPFEMSETWTPTKPVLLPTPLQPAIDHHPPVLDAPHILADTNTDVAVTFDGILPEESVDWFESNVMSWVARFMPQIEVSNGPKSRRKVESDGTIHYLITFWTHKSLKPVFPKFAIVHAIACMISHTGQELMCNLCLDVHDLALRNPCKAMDSGLNPYRVFYIPTDPHHTLSPVCSRSCIYLRKVYDNVAAALISLVKVEFRCPPSAITQHKLFDWQSRSYGIIKALIKSQLDVSRRMRDMLLATGRKRIIFVNGDLVLGSGDVTTAQGTIPIHEIHPDYIPGENYVGKIMEELRSEYRGGYAR